MLDFYQGYVFFLTNGCPALTTTLVILLMVSSSNKLTLSLILCIEYLLPSLFNESNVCPYPLLFCPQILPFRLKSTTTPANIQLFFYFPIVSSSRLFSGRARFMSTVAPSPTK